MDLALFAPHVGYYRRPGIRVGRGEGTDFYTATSSGDIFAALIIAVVQDLLGAEAAATHTFVEIGAEPDTGLLSGRSHPFAASQTIRLGEPLELAGPLIVFSNELFDAQPIRRFRARAGKWHELGVALDTEGLREVELAPAQETWLPLDPVDGYMLDAPRSAADLATRIAAQPWTGLFLALDYGKSWAELASEVPGGTARAYHRHRQSNDLLAQPGEQDLTAHVCWDWLAEALAANGFTTRGPLTQEALLARHAGAAIAPILQADATRLTARKQAILQLLHPAHMGQKFQALIAHRPPSAAIANNKPMSRNT